MTKNNLNIIIEDKNVPIYVSKKEFEILKDNLSECSPLNLYHFIENFNAK